MADENLDLIEFADHNHNSKLPHQTSQSKSVVVNSTSAKTLTESGVTKAVIQASETTSPTPAPTRGATVADLHRPKVVSQAEAKLTLEERELMKPLRTYQSDAASLVKETEADVIKINVAEQKRKEEKQKIIAKLPVEKRPPPPKAPRNTARLATTVSVILVLLGSGILGAIWFFRPMDSTPTFETTSTIIPYDQKVVLDLGEQNRQEIINTFADQLNQTEAAISSVVYFELVSGNNNDRVVIDFNDFLNRLDSAIPEPLRRALSERFMSGALVFDGVKPFIVFTTDYFDIAFPGMLDWEVNLYRDFGALLGTVGSVATVEAPTSTANIINRPITSPGFSDLVIANRDTRVLTDANSQTVLVYSFLDKNTIIITPDEVVFKELLNKFLNSQLIR